MAVQFKEQGGVAAMDPSPLIRWLTSRIMSKISGLQHLEKKRAKSERQRVSKGDKHVVEYFHQVEDAYSHLAAQLFLFDIGKDQVERAAGGFLFAMSVVDQNLVEV